MDDLGKVSQINIGDKKFLLKPLPASKNFPMFCKLVAVLTPVLASGFSSIADYQQSAQNIQDILVDGGDTLFEEAPKIDFFSPSVILSDALTKPELQEVVSAVTSELYYASEINGVIKPVQKVNLEKDFQGDDFETYLLLVEQALKVNFASPLVSWLKRKGFWETISSLQPELSALLLKTEQS